MAALKKIKFRLISPERIVHQDEVESVTLPTESGEITVLPNHVPLLTSLIPGVVELHDGNDAHILSVSTGVIKVDATGVTILADTAEQADELVEDEIEKAQAEAKKVMEEKKTDSVEFAKAVAMLEREGARMKAIRRKKKRKSL